MFSFIVSDCHGTVLDLHPAEQLTCNFSCFIISRKVLIM